MKHKPSQSNLYWIVFVFIFIAFVVFSVVIFRMTIPLLVRLFLFVCPLIFVVFGVASWYLSRKALSKFTNDIDKLLDEMIIESKEISFVFNEETLISKLQVKLKRLYEIMQSHTRQSLEEKEAIQGLVSDISHQVKTPIANIKMYLGILQDRTIAPEQQHDFLAAMAMQTDKLDFLMQSMVKMSRLETGVITMQPKLSPIYNTIAQALSGVEPQAENKSVQISIQCEETLKVTHDEKWTAEALFNIMENAVKYTPAGGQIDITVIRWEVFTKIEIADTGKGIPEQSHAAIFKRFYREPDVHNQEGVGVGLYLSRKIISMQGGYIEVKSAPGQGSAFSVFIPN